MCIWYIINNSPEKPLDKSKIRASSPLPVEELKPIGWWSTLA